MHTLLLRLEGPLQSWGTTSRFTQRDTGAEPSKSGVIGLLCAALGKPRLEEPGHEERWPTLSTLATLRMGVRVDRSGSVGIDFQTAGGGQMAGQKYGVSHVHGGLFGSVMSHRFYLQDAAFLVGLSGSDRALLEELNRALAAPVWALYLGRKSYVPSTPVCLDDGLLDVGLETALAQYRPDLADTSSRLVLEADSPEGAEARMDQPVDFARRLFGRRYVRVEPWSANESVGR